VALERPTLQIFFCSRTHSQLSQFVREVQKSSFGASVRLVSLASRSVLCVNEKVSKLSSSSAVNDKCLDLQKKKKQKGQKKGCGGGCPYYKRANIDALKDQALLQVMDIEELISAGRRVRACPYYAARAAVEDAQVVTLPYNTLLHAPTREAVGIDLRNSAVIVDEAHNVLDVLARTHAAAVSGRGLIDALQALRRYASKYRSRLNPKNLLNLKQLAFAANGLLKVMLTGKAVKSEELRPDVEVSTVSSQNGAISSFDRSPR